MHEKFEVYRTPETQRTKFASNNGSFKRKFSTQSNKIPEVKLPIKLDKNAIKRLNTSQNLDPNLETRLKEIIEQGFASGDTL